MTTETIQEKLSHKNFYSGILCNDPKPLPDQSEPEVILYEKYSDKPVEFSVIVPVFNQENIIKKNILSIIDTMDGDYELIIILDSCVDSTENILLELFKNKFRDNLVRIILIRQQTPVFETTCDNMGFVISSGKYILEIQADMEMVEYSFNKNLARGMEKYDDIIGISGRCTHNFGSSMGIGKMGYMVQEPLPKDIDRNTMYMYGTCNRGPLLLHPEKLKEMQFMDEQNYFLHNSDHDLFARAYYLKGWKCGYIPIEFKSSLNDGSTRKDIDPRVKQINQHFFSLREQRSTCGFEKNVYNMEKMPIEMRQI
jgi:glycosyltransferase involved in cell wall biosynthesis